MEKPYKITLKNGTELNCVSILGQNRFIKGASRDSLTFAFDSSEYSMDSLRDLFNSPENTKEIKSVFEGNEYTYLDYSILSGISVEDVVTEKETNISAETSINLIQITVGQKSYSEKLEEERTEQLNSLSEVVADMLGGAL